jgi:hypothetical protein
MEQNEDPSKSALDSLKKLFDPKYQALIPCATGLDIFRIIDSQKPLSTGLRVIDEQLPQGLETGQIVEIRGRSNSGKVCLSISFLLFFGPLWLMS